MKRILCICCAAVLFGLSLAVPVFAAGPVPVIELNQYDYDWTLAGEFEAQYYADKYPNILTVNDDGYCVLRSDYSSSKYWALLFPAVSSSWEAGVPVRLEVEALDNTIFNVRENFSPHYYRLTEIHGSFNCCYDMDSVIFRATLDSGVKSVKYFTGVKKPFGTGGISNTPSDLKYASGFLSDVWDDLWNAVSSSWWLMSFIVLGLAGCLITIIANLVVSFQPRYKDGVKVWGLAGVLRRRVVDSRKYRHNSELPDEELVTVDGTKYYPKNRRIRYLRQYYRFRDDDSEAKYDDVTAFKAFLHFNPSSGSRNNDKPLPKPSKPKKPVNVDIEVDD